MEEATKEGAQLALTHDREIGIAMAGSRMAKRWNNKTIRISAFVKKLSETVRTQETFDEYMSFPKSEQDSVKDIGGYVGGVLKDGLRRKNNVQNRQLLTYDIDYGKEGTVDKVKRALKEYAYTISSTHKHTSKKPRLRLVVYPDRPMHNDEFGAVARKVASLVDMEVFDDGSYDVNRLLFWPSTSVDGEFLFYHNDAPFLPVDEALAEYGDHDAWKDATLWPRSTRETKALDRLLKKQSDPLSKTNIVGALCRIIPIGNALDEHLKDVYRKEGRNRYTFIDGTSSNGLVIYDEKFAYSNHSSDPMCGQLCNSFDLLRIHQFGHLDDEAKVGTPTHRLPSYKAMGEWARDNKDIKAELVKGKIDVEAADFDVFDSKDDADEEGKDGGKTSPKTVEVGEEGWQGKLQVMDSGKPLPTFFNAVVILRNDPKLRERMRWNEFTVNVESAQTGEYWSEKDSYQIREYVGGVYGVDFPEAKIEQAIVNNSFKHSYHPVRRYLEGLKWDGERRIETIFIDYFGCSDNIYVREVGQCWFSAAVHRIFEPGYKFDTTLVIGGVQGIGKTSFIRELGLRKWYGELSSFDDKLAVEQMSGKWIIEISEMSATNKHDLEQQKSFLSACHTRVRLAYARHARDYKRQCVFFASTNRNEYLKDSTGNRRWWPLEATVKEVNIKKLRGEIHQIWAEAYMLWVQSKSVFLSKEASAVALIEQENKRESDPWQGIIEAWIETEAYNDRYATKEGSFEGMVSKLEQRQKVCVAEIWDDCFDMKMQSKPLDRNRIAGILDLNPNWKRNTSKSGSVSNMRFGKRYGQQVGWIKITPS
jgi:putative DNA primase/helicase